MEHNNTLAYYNSCADEFCRSTVTVEFTAIQDRFLEKLEKGSCILDFGCGSGRDTKYFLKRGYQVEAIDGSLNMELFPVKETDVFLPI